MKEPSETAPVAVSVVIPTYNHRDTVLETLGSVFAQTWTDLEVIVVVDGSPDDTAERLRPLAEAGRIRLIEQENQGQAAARNVGWKIARGAFIAFLDDDDLWPPEKLSWQVDDLRADPDAVLSYGDFAWLLPDGILHPDEQTGFPSGRVHRDFCLRNWMLSPGQALIRRSALERVGGFDPEVWGSDDWDLFIRLAREGAFLYRHRVALHYRSHDGNASRQAVRHARNHLKVVRRHIGWNLALLIRHQLLASRYFVPNLLQQARDSRARGYHALAVKAYLYVLIFDVRNVARRSFVRQLAASLLRLPPSRTREPTGR